MPESSGEKAPPRLVEVLESEDSEYGWAQGHIEPALMLLSAVANRMMLCGGDEAYQMFLGGEVRTLHDGQTWASVHRDRLDRANDTLASVAYFWLREDPENEENMLTGEPGEPGVSEWTRVDLPW